MWEKKQGWWGDEKWRSKWLANQKEEGKQMANLWRDKPLSELEKQLVDREKQLAEKREGPGYRGKDMDLMEEWAKLDATREEREKERNTLAVLDMEQMVKDGKQMEQWLKSLKRADGAVYPDIAGNGSPELKSYKYGKALTDGDGNAVWKDPNNNRLFIKPGAKVGNAFGAKMNKASVVKNKSTKDFLSMTNNKVIVSGGKFGCGRTNGDIAGALADGDIEDLMNISSNTVIITGGTGIKVVFGGSALKGTVSENRVIISNSVTIGGVVS